MPALRASSDADLQDLSKLTDVALDAKIAALTTEKQGRQSTLIIGAAGAIGQRLCAALAAQGHRVIAADRMWAAIAISTSGFNHLAPISQPQTTRHTAVRYGLLGTQADRVLLGAWDGMLCPNWG